MQSARPSLGRALAHCCALLCVLGASASLFAADHARIQVTNYNIDVELTPKTHHLVGRAKVTLTALEDLNTVVLGLHNGLRPTKVTDEKGKPLPVERVTQDSTLRVSMPQGLSKNQSTTLTFDYEGNLESADNSPVEGLKLAYVGDDTSYLLYAGEWFPMSGYNVDRFTATINVTVPSYMDVIGSGLTDKKVAGPGRATWSFAWDKPSFPGTIIAGNFQQTTVKSGGVDATVYLKPNHANVMQAAADTAIKEFEYYSATYGPAWSRKLSVVELPNDTVPSAWAPEVAALNSTAFTEKLNYRLLADSIAHQWWGTMVSPASRDDAWLGDGFARYSAARYIQFAAGNAGYQEDVREMEVGALAYDNIPLSTVGKLDPFSPEFQSLVTDKGGMILHMLHWVIGDAAFDKTMKQFVQQYSGKSATVDDFRELAEKNYGDQLTWFFAQWLDSTGAPEFKNKYAVYRIAKGFRVTGEISQDMDLFRMPVELKIDTDGPSETKRIEVVGTNSPYVVETFTKPRKITIDPEGDVLHNSPDFKVRVAILRGQQLVQQGDLAGALKEFQKALDVNPNSSLAHYRIAEVFFLQRNYQAAANEYREVQTGDLDPRWTEVWSYVQLGKIFDLTGQRERALNEYRKAMQTRDNTQGAQEEVRKYLNTPYQRPRSTSGD